MKEKIGIGQSSDIYGPNFNWSEIGGPIFSTLGFGRSRLDFFSSENNTTQGRHLLKMIGRALMLIFTTSKPFLPCNAIGIMLKFRNYW